MLPNARHRLLVLQPLKKTLLFSRERCHGIANEEKFVGKKLLYLNVNVFSEEHQLEIGNVNFVQKFSFLQRIFREGKNLTPPAT